MSVVSVLLTIFIVLIFLIVMDSLMYDGVKEHWDQQRNKKDHKVRVGYDDEEL